MHKKHLRDTLQRLMAKQQISATRLGETTGVPQPTISRLLNGTTDTMEWETLQLLGAALGVTVSQLIGEVPIEDDEQRQRAYILLQEVPAYQLPAAVKILDALAQPAPTKRANDQ
jgi:DNA-binding Xre family transcriptional regulator